MESPEASTWHCDPGRSYHHGSAPLPLFICYAHANERIVRQLIPGLKVLARRSYIARGATQILFREKIGMKPLSSG